MQNNKIIFSKNILFVITLCVGTIFCCVSCKEKNPLKINISNINLSIEVVRFDKDIASIKNNTDDIYKQIDKISEKYPVFFDIYNDLIIGIDDIENNLYPEYLKTFLNDYAVVEAMKNVEKVFPNVNNINKELSYCFKHIKYYYPDYEIPEFLAFVGGYKYSIISHESYTGIGLDKYLGTDCKYYDLLDVPMFSKIEMTPEQIPVDVIKNIAENKYEYYSETDNLLNKMIYNGKILYFVDAMMPDFDEARKNKYTQEQLNFCKHYEKKLWAYLIENKLLFTTDYLTIKKLTDNAPYTSYFGQDSPPRIANWLGLQIVKSYMKHHKNISLKELMEDENYQKILNLSKYAPK